MKRRLGRAGWWGLFFLSGVPALMAQVAWARILAGGLGHEFPALTGVVAACFAGMGLGAWVAARVGWGGDVAGRVYGWLEVGSGLWILGSLGWVTPGLEWVRVGMGLDGGVWREAVVGFGFGAMWVGPAAAAMGATLPVLERALRPMEAGGRAVGGLYGWNTAGAVVGMGLAVGVLMPVLGFRGTLVVAAVLQVACGLVAWWWAGDAGGERGGIGGGGVGGGRRVDGGGVGVGGLWVVFATGFLGIGFELLGVRALAQVTENTVRTYGWAVGSVLMGMALGAWLERRWGRRGGGWLGSGWGGIGVQGCLGVGSVWVLGWGVRGLEGLRGVLGGAWWEGLVSVVVFVPVAVGMGWVYARWVQDAGEGEAGVGRAVAWNCFGAALAGPVCMGVLLPWAGLRGALVVVAGGYLLLVPWRRWREVGWGIPVAWVVLAAGVPFGVRFLELPAGSTVVRSWDGRMAAVAVIRTADGGRVLRVNNHFQQGGTATAVAARRHAHLPLLVHPAPGRALFLGVGTGITMGAAVDHPGLEVEGVELLPEVVAALGEFEPENRGVRARAGVRVTTADARRFVRVGEGTYDVIVADLFHPAEDGAGMLYTREHFAAIRGRLRDGGVFCQWLPMHQLDMAGFRDVGATFLEVFPEASLWLLRFNVDVPVVGLMGWNGTERGKWDPARLGVRMGEGELGLALKPLALTDPVRLLGCRVAGGASLRRLVVGGRVATDDLPRVMFGAAEAVYRVGEPPHRRLLELLEGGEPEFRECLAGDGAGGWAERLERFREARDRHLRGLGREAEGRRREALEDYLGSAELSAEYTAGYAQAVLVASAYAAEDPELARGILERLVRVRPEQGLAREVLGRLAGGKGK